MTGTNDGGYIWVPPKTKTSEENTDKDKKEEDNKKEKKENESKK